jgi:hypothetical protein
MNGFCFTNIISAGRCLVIHGESGFRIERLLMQLEKRWPVVSQRQEWLLGNNMDNCLHPSLDEGSMGETTKVAGLKIQSLRLK